MPSNEEAAEMLRGIADLLDLTGERFKPEAYRRAARSLESLPESLQRYAARGELRSIPGVGEAIAKKLEEYLKTGKLAYYERLKQEAPPGVVAIMRLPGIGPKTARRLWTEVGIDGAVSFREAIDAGRLNGLKGFGPRKIELFKEALASASAVLSTGRIPIVQAYPTAQRLLTGIKTALIEGERAEPAGSLRRGRETVGDLDLLVSSLRPREVFDAVGRIPGIAQVVLRGDTKMTVKLDTGLQVDVRVVEPESYGSALVYFTGSKDHNIRIRTLARERGLKINEYGVYRGDDRVAGHSEVDVYRALGLPWIPPEIREDHGEVEAAGRRELPSLVGEGDLKGELHWHVPDRAGVPEIDAFLAEARRRRFEYIGAVVEGLGSDGEPLSLSSDVRECLERRRERHRPGEPYVWLVGEVAPGSRVRIPEGLDYLVLRGGPTTSPPRAHRTWPVVPRVLAHLADGSGSKAGGADLRASWLTFAREAGLGVEIGAVPGGLDSDAARQARESEAPIVISTGLSVTPGDPAGPVSLAWARRAWVTPERVLNARRYREFPRSSRTAPGQEPIG